MNNPWEKIYTEATPADFEKPYSKFDLILSELKINDVEKVLDVTIGNGRHCIELAKNGFSVYGFDISEKIVALCRKKIEKLGLKANIDKADMFKRYPYDDAYFDAVIAIQAIYHGTIDNFNDAIKETRRILKKNKPFIFTVSKNKTRSALGAMKPEFKKIDEYTLIPINGREKGLIHFYPTAEMINNITTKYFSKVKIIDDKDNQYYLVICI